MSKVHTIKGLIDRDLLTVKDIVTEGDNHRSIATDIIHLRYQSESCR